MSLVLLPQCPEEESAALGPSLALKHSASLALKRSVTEAALGEPSPLIGVMANDQKRQVVS